MSLCQPYLSYLEKKHWIGPPPPHFQFLARGTNPVQKCLALFTFFALIFIIPSSYAVCMNMMRFRQILVILMALGP